jgi:CHAT domain-containing protein
LRRTPREPATIVAAPDYGPGRFAPLANAGAEASEVAERFTGARVLRGAQATKQALAALHGPAVLHVATHGFFTRDLAMPAGPVMADAQERGMDVEGMLAPVQLAETLDPAGALDRAGLALARANVSPDGIVTAREITHYDWWGTELVVLSACETGVGAATSGDGVYGLRRALALAGAESQVVSLWSVGETSVRALMRAFYGELARGTGRAEALRRAKRWMLQQPAFAHPYYWAAFIPAGDWTPLDGHAGLRP